jgi:hypothetical protein
MTRVLGIDHPLILFRDLPAGVEQFRRLGFAPAPMGYHPWGTSMSFVTFERCAFELLSIYDASLIDKNSAGDFRFGRYIFDRLNEREGMSLVALYSTDAEADAATVEARGLACQGTIEFGRAVRLRDGREDRTACTLKILFDPNLKRVSHFICQQHRPDLVWREPLMTHLNGATGIASISYFAPDPSRLRDRFAGLYGAGAETPIDGGFTVQTRNGVFEVLDRQAVDNRFGGLPGQVDASEPAGIAVAVTVRDLAAATEILRRENVAFAERDGGILVSRSQEFGNIWIEFVRRT